MSTNRAVNLVHIRRAGRGEIITVKFDVKLECMKTHAHSQLPFRIIQFDLFRRLSRAMDPYFLLIHCAIRIIGLARYEKQSFTHLLQRSLLLHLAEQECGNGLIQIKLALVFGPVRLETKTLLLARRDDEYPGLVFEDDLIHLLGIVPHRYAIVVRLFIVDFDIVSNRCVAGIKLQHASRVITLQVGNMFVKGLAKVFRIGFCRPTTGKQANGDNQTDGSCDDAANTIHGTPPFVCSIHMPTCAKLCNLIYNVEQKAR